ncbi:unnamed protein product [Allacma fusca]|uniref:Rad21/Rec8-like protein N-terminal domain-containing protein n=1 Tax=Allacma fusca TaxID=39272 RepID=A0A8J2KLH4_9HEXA|nr:unnamed protein product [Allacma fusca]
MFQHQDLLYRNGPLSVVWLLGNRVLGLKRGRQKLRASILRANVSEICVLIMELMVIPRPLHAGDGLNRMSLQSISILVVGANRMYGMQLDSVLRRLEEILSKLRFRMLPFNEINLPPESSRGKKRVTTVLLSTGDFPADFGRCELDSMMEPLCGSAQVSQGGSRSLTPSAIEEFDFTSALMLSKKEERMRKKIKKSLKHVEARPEDEIEDDALIRLLNDSRSSARFNDVTMTELEPLSNLRDAEEENFGFEDFPDTRQITEVTEAMEVSVDIPDAGAQMNPIHSISLAERIRISRSVPPREPPPEPERRRKRQRRNQGLIFDSETCIASQELIQRRNHEEENSLNLADEVVAARVVILPDTHMPYHQQNAKTVKQITSVLGRTLGVTLSRFVSGIQNQITQRPDRIPEHLREAEIQNFGGSVIRIEPCEESSAAIDIGITTRSSAAPRISAAEEGTVSSDVRLEEPSNEPLAPISLNDGSAGFEVHPEVDYTYMNVQDTVIETEFLAEEIVTPHPQRTVDIIRPLDVAPAVPLDQSHGDHTEHRTRKTFSQMFPPEVTSRQKAAHEFFRLLRLQKEVKVKLHQDVFLGELTIEVLE